MGDNFIDFIVQVTNDAKLRKEFLDLLKQDAVSKDDLIDLLKRYGYVLKDSGDYDKILEARKNICEGINNQTKY